MNINCHYYWTSPRVMHEYKLYHSRYFKNMFWSFMLEILVFRRYSIVTSSN